MPEPRLDVPRSRNLALGALLLQGGIGGGTILLLIAIVAVVAVVLYTLVRSRAEEETDEEKPEPPAELEEGQEPTADLLEERDELEEPVEDYEDMSLAEIKRAKTAKVERDDGSAARKTAGEATEESRREHETLEEPEDEEPTAEAESTDEAEPGSPVPESVREGDETEEDEEGEGPELSVPDFGSDEEADSDEEEPEDEESGGLGLSVPSPDDVGEGEETDERGDEEPDEPESEAETGEEETDERAERLDEEPESPEPEVEDEREDEATEEEADEEPDEEAGEETDDETEQPEGESRSEGSTEVEPEADRPGEESVEGAEPEDADTAETDDEPDDAVEAEESPQAEEDDADETDADTAETDDAVETDEPGKSLEEGLEQTREGFFDKLGGFFEDESLDEDRVEEIEEFLFSADVGPRVAQDIIDAVEEKLSAEDLEDPQKIWGFIRHYCRELLQQHEEPLDPSGEDPFVILVVGVNGVGKTTTIGKMASKFKKQGHSVMLVAGDTFRAAAVEQLEIWAERTGFPMHRGEEGADPSSVIYEGIERAEEEDRDVVICDTSGRLHTDENLMDELAKMERVAGNAKEGAPHEVNLVLDANTGQNAIQQAKKFHEHLDISGLTLTKFDGTARGGVILGVCKRFEAPVRYIGIGERVADLREFDAEEFVEALFL